MIIRFQYVGGTGSGIESGLAVSESTIVVAVSIVKVKGLRSRFNALVYKFRRKIYLLGLLVHPAAGIAECLAGFGIVEDHSHVLQNSEGLFMDLFDLLFSQDF